MCRAVLVPLFLGSSIISFFSVPIALGADQGTSEKEIRQVDERWVKTVATKDAAAIAQFYTQDGALLAPGAPIAEGRSAIAKAWSDFVTLKNFHLDFSPTKIDIASSGDMAYEIGTYSLHFTSDDGTVDDKGKYVVVWKKLAGEWKAAADIFNSNEGD